MRSLVRSPIPAPLRRRGLHPLIALLAALALVSGACGTASPDPETRLSSAVDDTFDGAFGYRLAIDADRNALDALGEGAAQTAGFLAGFAISGVKDEAGALSVEVALGEGGTPLMSLRSFGDEAFYLNVGINDFLGMAGAGQFDPRDELAPALDALGFGPEIKTAVLDLLDGNWVGVEGELDAERIRTLLGADTSDTSEEDVEEATKDALGEDIGEFVERFVTVVETTDTDDGERFDVEFQVREFLRATSELSRRVSAEGTDGLEDLEADLQDLPETIPGTILVDDGKVTEMRFEVSGDDADGSVLVVLSLSDFDAVDDVERPEGATVLTDEQFTEAIAKLVGLTGGL